MKNLTVGGRDQCHVNKNHTSHLLIELEILCLPRARESYFALCFILKNLNLKFNVWCVIMLMGYSQIITALIQLQVSLVQV